MTIFNSYVSLPEGKKQTGPESCKFTSFTLSRSRRFEPGTRSFVAEQHALGQEQNRSEQMGD